MMTSLTQESSNSFIILIYFDFACTCEPVAEGRLTKSCFSCRQARDSVRFASLLVSGHETVHVSETVRRLLQGGV